MALENNFSLAAAANHAISFTDLAIRHLAPQPENTNVRFTHANPGAVKTSLADSFPFWARIPLKLVMALGLGVSADECAEFMLHGMPGADKGYRYIDNKGEVVTKKKAADEGMIDKVWHHTSQIINRNQ